MFCPKCTAYLTERDFVKRNVKYAMGNVAVEYDVRCPNCTEEIGHMFWGEFTAHAHVGGSHAAAEPVTEDGGEAAPASERVCPHCGQPWPEVK